MYLNSASVPPVSSVVSQPKHLLNTSGLYVPTSTVCHASTSLDVPDVGAAVERCAARHEEMCRGLRGVMKDLNEVVERGGRVVEEGIEAGWAVDGGGGVGGGVGIGGSREFEVVLECWGDLGRELHRKQCMADAVLGNTEGLMWGGGDEGEGGEEWGGRQVAEFVEIHWGDEAEGSRMNLENLQMVLSWSS